MNHDEKLRITEGLLAISDRADLPGFERPLELTIVARPDVVPWRYPPRIDFQYGEWLRDQFERGELDPETPTSADLAILLTSVLAASRPLIGPPAAEVLSPVPSADFRRAMTDELEPLLADLATDTRNIILTLARIWATLGTGQILTKDGAADWALARLPEEHRPVVARARAIYLDRAAEGWDDLQDRLQPSVDALIERIRAAS
jgi:streptomycin 3"-adenylyltransferase